MPTLKLSLVSEDGTEKSLKSYSLPESWPRRWVEFVTFSVACAMMQHCERLLRSYPSPQLVTSSTRDCEKSTNDLTLVSDMPLIPTGYRCSAKSTTPSSSSTERTTSERSSPSS